MKYEFFLTLFLLPFLAGCIGSPEPTAPNPLDDFRAIDFSDCIEATTFGDADAEGKQTQPRAWQGSFESYSYYISLVNCQKIGVGPYESMDATILLESISPSEYPESCRLFTDPAFIVKVIQKIWTTDPALQHHLEEALRMPVGLIVGTSFPPNFQPGTFVEYDWETNDNFSGQASALQASSFDSKFNRNNLMIWEINNGLGIAQIDEIATRSNLNQGPSQTMASDRPLMPDTMSTAGLASMGNYDRTWTLTFTEGSECE